MASAGSIFVDLLLRDSNYQQGFARVRRTTSSSTNIMSRDLNTVKGQFENLLNPINSVGTALRNLAVISGAAFSLQGIIAYSDKFKQLQGRLSIVETDARSLVQVQEELFKIAQTNRTPLEGVTNFYQRLNQFIPETVRHQYDLLGVTKNVTAALAITGESSESSNAALVQFTQAIGTNFEAAGQELRTLQEQAPRLAQALQNALGDGTKSLQTLKAEGKLTRDSVLRALSGIGKEGEKLAQELAKIPTTVSQAFVRLDNAFLKYVGQSKTIQGATASLSSAITKISENIDVIANAFTTLSIVVSARYAAALVAANLSTVNLAINTIRLNVAIASFASTSVLATSATLALAAATRALAAALKLIIPVAVIAALYEIIDGNESLISTQQDLNTVVNETAKELDNVYQRHGKLTEEAKAQVNERIEAYRKEVEALEKILSAQLENRSKVGLLLRGFKDFAGETVVEGMFGKDYQSLDEVVKKQQAYNQTIVDLNGLLEKQRTLKKDGVNVGGEASKKTQEELNKLLEKYRSVLTGVDEDTLRYMDSLKDLEKIKKATGATDEQLIEWQKRLREQYEESINKNNQLTEFAKRAAQNIQDSFADFLFDPFKNGLRGMLISFVDTMRKMIAEATAAQLAKRIFGDLSGGKGSGILGGLFSGGGLGGLFGSQGSIARAISGVSVGPLPMFAEGGFLGPGQFGIAGEAGAELLYGGRTGVSVMPMSNKGGNVYNIDARGADQGAVARIETALLAMAGPGVIERRVNNAQRRGTIR